MHVPAIAWLCLWGKRIILSCWSKTEENNIGRGHQGDHGKTAGLLTAAFVACSTNVGTGITSGNK